MNLEQDKNTDKDTKDSPENPEVTNEESTAEEKSEAPEAKEEEKVEEPVSSEQEDEDAAEKEEPSSEEKDEVEEVAESENESISANEEEAETEASDSDADDNSKEYYTKILSKIKEVLETKDWGLISNEFSNLSLHIGEGPEPDEESKALLKEFDELRSDFEERKKLTMKS